ncbi:MAG: DEAD/DEAH box helicase [Lachnospiraceae bacterium]|nr:DEAD/DEAH box helicase [Lachnospiraceae bacterium]
MKPDLQLLARQTDELQELKNILENMPQRAEQLKKAASALCLARVKERAAKRLGEIPSIELKNARSGIKASALANAGFLTLYDIYTADDRALLAVNGIGEKQLASIRMIMDEFLARLSRSERIRLSDDRNDPENAMLIVALVRYSLVRQISEDSRGVSGKVNSVYSEIIKYAKIRSAIHWFFSLPGTKRDTENAFELAQTFFKSQDYERASRFASLYSEAVTVDTERAFEEYEKNSADLYAVLESVSGENAAPDLIYGSIPAALAAKIRSLELSLSSFRGDLRSYQRFGAQYALHQKKVLLGDEMGLGKTIQAIAVMAHLMSTCPGSRFLIICPASVMINWQREIRKFIDADAYILHGAGLLDNFEKWAASGGAAITNYESMRRITDRIDEKMELKLLVVDEAHYIKNPEAQRTRYIRRLDNESEYILMMTGTPLENKVDEMCELIAFLRPDIAAAVREQAGLRRAGIFRETLAPVYLRRQADQVLDELPELIENSEWCALTPSDLASYAKEVRSGNFMGMRRVSFLGEGTGDSAKASRLLELTGEAREEGKKVIVFSYFRETLRKVGGLLGARCAGEITGNIDPAARQEIIDRFCASPEPLVLLCQVQAGGTGLNIQAASVVIFCEPQIKPSLERQAIARVYRMGQIRKVVVFHLLCENTVDEAVIRLLEDKRKEFSLFADESAMADAEAELTGKDWIRDVVEAERKKYLPMVVE